MPLMPGDPVCLRDRRGRVVGLQAPAADAVVRVPGLGVLPGRALVDAGWGGQMVLGSHAFTVLHPTPALIARAVEHVTQVVHAKDTGRILAETGVAPGMVVVEGGTGSGALTAALALAVGAGGRVHGHEPNAKHREATEQALGTFGLGQRVTLHARTLEACEVRDADVFVVDVPDPAPVVPAAAAALAPGGRLAVYAVQLGQAQATVAACGAAGFLDVQVLEVLERPWVVDERRARPSHDMLGHTAFLLFAVRGA